MPFLYLIRHMLDTLKYDEVRNTFSHRSLYYR